MNEDTTDAIRHAEVEVETGADPAAVWKALTSDQGLAQWMGPGSHIVPQLDGVIEVDDPATGQARRGHVEDVLPGERLDFTWWPVDDPENGSRVSIVLEPTEVGTRIRVTESVGMRAEAKARPDAVARTTASWLWRASMLAVVAGLAAVTA